jgi:hypothetical protein
MIPNRLKAVIFITAGQRPAESDARGPLPERQDFEPGKPFCLSGRGNGFRRYFRKPLALRV